MREDIFDDMEKIREAYATLESNSMMSDGEINKNYRRLSKIYHPDVSEFPIEYAQAKMALINDAYDLVKTYRQRESNSESDNFSKSYAEYCERSEKFEEEIKRKEEIYQKLHDQEMSIHGDYVNWLLNEFNIIFEKREKLYTKQTELFSNQIHEQNIVDKGIIKDRKLNERVLERAKLFIDIFDFKIFIVSAINHLKDTCDLSDNKPYNKYEYLLNELNYKFNIAIDNINYRFNNHQISYDKYLQQTDILYQSKNDISNLIYNKAPLDLIIMLVSEMDFYDGNNNYKPEENRLIKIEEMIIRRSMHDAYQKQFIGKKQYHLYKVVDEKYTDEMDRLENNYKDLIDHKISCSSVDLITNSMLSYFASDYNIKLSEKASEETYNMFLQKINKIKEQCNYAFMDNNSFDQKEMYSAEMQNILFIENLINRKAPLEGINWLIARLDYDEKIKPSKNR